MATAKPTITTTNTHEASPPRPIALRDFVAAFRNIELPPTWFCVLVGALLGVALALVAPS